MARGIIMSLTAICLGGLVILLIIGAPIETIGALSLATVAFPLSGIPLRREDGLTWCATTLLGTTLAAIMGIAMVGPQIASPVIEWLTIVPVIAVALLGGRGAAVAWVAASGTLAIVSLFSLQSHPVSVAVSGVHRRRSAVCRRT